MLEEAPTVGDGAVNAEGLAAVKKRKLAASLADAGGESADSMLAQQRNAPGEMDGDDMDSETELLYAQAMQVEDTSDDGEPPLHQQKKMHLHHGPHTMPSWSTAVPHAIGLPSRVRSRSAAPDPKTSRRSKRCQAASPRETPHLATGPTMPSMERHQSRQPQTPNPEAAMAEPSLTRTADATHRSWPKCVQIHELKMADFFQAPSRSKADIKQKFAVEVTKLKPYLQHIETLFSANGSQTTNQTIKSDLTNLKRVGTAKVDKRLGQEGKDTSFSVKCGHLRTILESGRDLRAACLVPSQHL